MAKQATRLSEFQIPRNDGVGSESIGSGEVPAAPQLSAKPASSPSSAAVSERLPEQVLFPVRIAPRPPAEPRQAMTVRLPVSMHERMRILMFTSRRSQQDIVEEALNAFLKGNGT